MDNGQKDIVLFQTQRAFTVACKRFLCLLEDLKNEHKIHFSKLKGALPDPYESLIDQADYFDNDKYSYLRKKVFDIGGDCNRELQDELNKFRMELIRNESVQQTRSKGQEKQPDWKESKY